jgi:type II secretory pathway pseudopilin PulG
MRGAEAVRIDPSDLALEIISIVIAIVLATAVGGFVAHYQAGERTRAALAQIRLEIAHDDEALGAVRAPHVRLRDAFRTLTTRTLSEQLSFDTFSRTFATAAPRGIHPFDGTTTAWELARGSNALDDLPYELRATLQTRYAELAGLQALNNRTLSQIEFSPADDRPNFYFTAVALSLNLSDMTASEDRLARDDATALRALADHGIR